MGHFGYGAYPTPNMRAFFKFPLFSAFDGWRNWVGVSVVLAMMPLFSNAQTVTTVPVGAMTYTFPATSQTTTTYISIPLTNPSVYTLPVASFTANTITFSGTPFPAGGLAQAGSPFFARIATGAQAGRIILVTANTTSAITVDTTDNSSQTTGLDTSGWALAAGDRVEIIVGDTLASLFGDNTVSNPLIFAGSTSPFSADSIGLYNKTTGKTDNYYFNTASGYWRLLTANVNSNTVIIRPEVAINITRLFGRSQVLLTVTGDVPYLPHLTKVTGGSTSVFTGSRYPVDMKLSSFSYTGWVKSNSVFSADTVNIYNPVTGKFEVYFQRLDNSLWNKVGSGTTDQSNVTISGGAGYSITKTGAISGGSSFFNKALPYTL